jgi:hypothetical protein
MKTPQILLFCSGSLAATLALAAALYPFAVVDPETFERSRAPQAMEVLPDIDLGPDFGRLPVVELMGYYMENPPQPARREDTRPTQQHFGGC